MLTILKDPSEGNNKQFDSVNYLKNVGEYTDFEETSKKGYNAAAIFTDIPEYECDFETKHDHDLKQKKWTQGAKIRAGTMAAIATVGCHCVTYGYVVPAVMALATGVGVTVGMGYLGYKITKFGLTRTAHGISELIHHPEVLVSKKAREESQERLDDKLYSYNGAYRENYMGMVSGGVAFLCGAFAAAGYFNFNEKQDLPNIRATYEFIRNATWPKEDKASKTTALSEEMQNSGKEIGLPKSSIYSWQQCLAMTLKNDV